MPARDSYMDGGKPARSAVPQQMDVPGFGGRYYIRIDGTVWRRRKSKDTRMRGVRRGRNREYKLTTPEGRTICKTASAIMRETYFRGLPQNMRLVHKDGLESNWAYWNLQPMTLSEMGKKHNRGIDARCVLKIDPATGEVVQIFQSAREAGRAAFCCGQTIADACNHRSKKRPGICWPTWTPPWTSWKRKPAKRAAPICSTPTAPATWRA